ncbi:MAG: hypothetical protein PW735_10395 [Acidobacteriaceae bacterium]|nr:hypothetical protein [Acidobacteriaceae bacterium]
MKRSYLSFRCFSRLAAVSAAAGAVSTLTGCGIGSIANQPDRTISGFKGVVHGGQSPIQDATVTLYHTDPSATSYGAAGVVIGTATSDANGNFVISPSATSTNCPAGAQAYITAAGGYQTGQSTLVNTEMLEVAALGDCSSISASTSVIVNEVTTVAAAYALSGFSTTKIDSSSNLPVAQISAPSAVSGTTATATAPAGLVHAFANAANLVDYTSGMPNATITANGGTTAASSTVTGVVPYAEILTLADAMQSCVDSGSAVGGESANCTSLFGYTPSIKNITPTNTFQAFVNLARNPYPSSGALSGILGLTSATSAFQPTLTAAPGDWSLSIVYGKGSLLLGYFTALDANDTFYFGVSAATASTSPIYGVSAYGASVPAFANPSSTVTTTRGLAADQLGNIWVAYNTAVVDRFNTISGAVDGSYTSPYNYIWQVAVDRSNDLWMGHVIGSTTNIDELAYSNGSWSANYTSAPGTNTGSYGIAVDNNQNIWAAGYYNSGTTEVLLPNLGTVSAPSYTTQGTAITAVTATVGAKPYSTVFDPSGNAWVGITGSTNSLANTGIVEATPNASLGATSISVGNLITGSTAGSNSNVLGTLATQEMAIDGAGTIFIPDNNSSTQGIHMYATGTSNTLTPSTGLKSCYLATSAATTCGTGTGAAVYNPRQPAVDSTGSVWAGMTGGGVVQLIGVAAPTYPVLAVGKWSTAPGLSTAASLP